MSKCTGVMGWVFGHKWIRYGVGQEVSTTVSCTYLHWYHPKRKSCVVPVSGSLCQCCGAVTGEKK